MWQWLSVQVIDGSGDGLAKFEDSVEKPVGF